MAVSPIYANSRLSSLKEAGYNVHNSIRAVKEDLLSIVGSDDLMFLDVHNGYEPTLEVEWVSDPHIHHVFAIPFMNEYTLDAWCESAGIKSNLKDGEDLKLIIDDMEETEVSISATEMLSFGARILDSNLISLGQPNLSLNGKKIFVNALMDYAQSFRTA